MEDLDLQEIANNRKKKKAYIPTDVSEDTEVNDTQDVDMDDDAPVINIGNGVMSASDIANTPTSDDSDLVNASTKPSSEITEEDLRTVMPDLSDEAFAIASKDTLQKLSSYKKNLMVKNGFTPEEADEAARNRMETIGKEVNNEYLAENPKLGVIEIDKKNLSQISFTDAEKAKLSKVKAIKLIAVEDQELKTIKLDKVEKKNKSAYIKTVEGSLSKYSVPMPLLGDYLVFNGAQIIQLMSAVKYDDEGLDELIAKKASLIYDRLSYGTITHKYNEDGTAKMSYNDFINTFKFHDIDLGLYAILVASSMEENETNLTCAACKANFVHKYNIKTLLKADLISDNFKEIFETILSHRGDEELLTSIADKHNKVLRFKSPYTSNIYDIAYPSVGRAIRIYNAIDQKDENMIYLSVFGLFINSMYIYNAKSESYVQIESDEIKLLMETLQSISQADIDIIYNEIKDMIYTPKFVLESQCPECGNKMSNNLMVDELVFLKAQDSFMEMR